MTDLTLRALLAEVRAIRTLLEARQPVPASDPRDEAVLERAQGGGGR